MKNGFCVFTDTVCEGRTPCVSDEKGYIVFETEAAAQREIVEDHIERLQQFLRGEREFDDAMEVQEYVLPVTVQDDGKITTEDGDEFPSKPD